MSDTRLRRFDLLPETIKKIQRVGDWASHALFETRKENSWQNCTDKARWTYLSELLDQPGIKEKAAKPDSRHFIIRVTGPLPGYFGSSQGPAYVYPLRIHDGTSAEISGIKLEIGHGVEITGTTFYVTHGVDFLASLTVDPSRPHVHKAQDKVEEPGAG